MTCAGCYNSGIDATAVFMCLTCKHARATGFTTCSISAISIVAPACKGTLVAVAGPGCQIGRGPDMAGIVRWRGMRWRGVPRPLWWLLSDGFLARAIFGLPSPAAKADLAATGCGCLDAGKRFAEWLLGGPSDVYFDRPTPPD